MPCSVLFILGHTGNGEVAPFSSTTPYGVLSTPPHVLDLTTDQGVRSQGALLQ